MKTCQYCSLEATFAYRINPTVFQYFCSFHVPSFLKSRLYMGRLVRIEELDLPAPVATAPKKTTKKKAVVEEAPVVEETPAEAIDIIVEEPVAEESVEGPSDGTD